MKYKRSWPVDPSFKDFLTYELHSPSKVDPSSKLSLDWSVDQYIYGVGQFHNRGENVEHEVQIGLQIKIRMEKFFQFSKIKRTELSILPYLI